MSYQPGDESVSYSTGSDAIPPIPAAEPMPEILEERKVKATPGDVAEIVAGLQVRSARTSRSVDGRNIYGDHQLDKAADALARLERGLDERERLAGEQMMVAVNWRERTLKAEAAAHQAAIDYNRVNSELATAKAQLADLTSQDTVRKLLAARAAVQLEHDEHQETKAALAIANGRVEETEARIKVLESRFQPYTILGE